MRNASGFVKLAGLMFFGGLWIQFLNCWLTKHSGDFASPERARIIGAVLIAPASYIFLRAYAFGFGEVFPGRIWPITITSWVINIAISVLWAWIIFRQLPTANALVAIVALSVATIAVAWR